jgi:prephenate dehydrogenase
MRLAFLGFGLIGGSVARALRQRAGSGAFAADAIVAWSPSGDGPARAAADGVIDAAADSPEQAISGADLVVLAAPPNEVLAQLDDLAGPWRESLGDDSVVTDVASTKTAIVDRAATRGLRFVGGHPMAGRETSGYEASTPDLFEGRPWVVVPGDDPAAVARVEALAVATGAVPRRMTAADHDAAVAAVSHLPLVVAAALVEAVVGGAAGPRPDWPSAAALAATGWGDMTRLARGDVAMGAGIAATNREALSSRVRDLIAVLEGWAADLEHAHGGDAAAIAERLRVARERLEGPA